MGGQEELQIGFLPMVDRAFSGQTIRAGLG
jgi:hypothetical protein